MKNLRRQMGEPRGFDSPYQTSKLFAALQCGYAFGNTGPDDEEYGFLSSGQNAIERYGEQEF